MGDTLHLTGQRPSHPPLPFGTHLTPRELEVLTLLGTWLTLTEIAERLLISPNTAKSHARSIYRKLGASNRREAVFRARHLGL